LTLSDYDILRKFGHDLSAFLDGVLNRPKDAGSADERDSFQSYKAFPQAGVDAFLSHFVLTVEFFNEAVAGQLITLSLPAAVQIVSRSEPVRYSQSQRKSRVQLPLPKGCSLAKEVGEADLLISPPNFFEEGRETVFLQILNLDARANTPFGPIRIILGETFKREYPDLFQPSFGSAQSLVRGGFPARLFFSPNAIIETPLGAYKTRPKALVAAEVDAFPPVGGAPKLLKPVELDKVDTLRSQKLVTGTGSPDAVVSALEHPIDADAELPTSRIDEFFQKLDATISHGRPQVKA
jgi:hypothetical protein